MLWCRVILCAWAVAFVSERRNGRLSCGTVCAYLCMLIPILAPATTLTLLILRSHGAGHITLVSAYCPLLPFIVRAPCVCGVCVCACVCVWCVCVNGCV